MPETVERFMRESDALSWYMERDPTLRSTVVALAFLDRKPVWDVLTTRLDQAIRQIPHFRMRLVEPPARLSTPRWEADGDFDLRWHLRRVDAPAPRTPATVLEMARIAATTAFDPAHPLWEFTVVERLARGRAALVMKMHHSLTDGVGGVQLAPLLFDAHLATSRREPVAEGPEPPVAGEDLQGAALAADSIRHDWAQFVHVVSTDLRRVPAAMLHAARHPVRTMAELTGTARSVGRTVAPVNITLSPIMQGRSLRRAVDVVSVDVNALKAGAAAAGGSLNDGFLAGVTGGLRRYHEVHGATVPELRVTLPINIRKEDDPAGGNRITLQRFLLPLRPADPALRMAVIGERCRAARDERSLPHTNAIAGGLTLLPPSVIGGILKHVDFVASNVPGPPCPVYLAGARVDAYVPFGPTIGAAFNATLLSYNGTCFVGVNVDEAAVADPAVLMACLVEGFNEVLGLAGDGASARLPLQPTEGGIPWIV